MTDFADMGAAREELDREIAIKHRAPAGPAATGVCLSCGETVAEGLRWCDAECRDDWQAQQRASKGARG